MNLKQQLLTPVQLDPVTVTILGGEHSILRLTAGRLNEHDKASKKHQENQDGEKLNIEAAKLLLDSILDENNKPMSESITPAELMSVQTPIAINSAVMKIMNVNFINEDAEVLAKKD